MSKLFTRFNSAVKKNVFVKILNHLHETEEAGIDPDNNGRTENNKRPRVTIANVKLVI